MLNLFYTQAKRSDTTKIALQASIQERKGEPLNPKKTEKLSKRAQLKLPGMIFHLREKAPRNAFDGVK